MDASLDLDLAVSEDVYQLLDQLCKVPCPPPESHRMPSPRSVVDLGDGVLFDLFAWDAVMSKNACGSPQDIRESSSISHQSTDESSCGALKRERCGVLEKELEDNHDDKRIQREKDCGGAVHDHCRSISTPEAVQMRAHTDDVRCQRT
mmetsp:Transcript_48822/g.93378  ORF Transcript_48822/g.93378 Transcript_48822/m.93378 type:complete len:148 (-) Transcript_48822:1213-1656(-)